MTKRNGTLLIFLMIMALIVSGCSNSGTKASASGEKIVLKYADYMPNTHFASVNGTQEWIKRVEERTDGRVEIKYFPGEQLGKGADILDLVKTGAADIGMVANSIVSGVMPLSGLVSLPGLAETTVQGSKAGFDLITTSPVLENDFLKNGVRPIYAFNTSPYEYWTTKKPIKKVEDLKGLKIRTSGTAASLLFEEVGAVPVSISAPEQYEALERNTLDGTYFSITTMSSYKLNEVVKYGTLGAGGGPIQAYSFINEDVWQSLPEDIQEIMLQVSEEVIYELSVKSEEEDQRIIDKFKSTGEVEFYEVDKEEFNKAAEIVVEGWIKTNEAKGLPAQEAIDIYKKALEKHK